MHNTGIVVAGAGMGGLAAAARLATAGHRVTVVERTAEHGGAVGRAVRDGFAFDTGPGLLYFPAVWRDLFLKTGRQPLEEVVELRRVEPGVEHRFADGVAVRLPGFSVGAAGQALDRALGDGAGERWRAVLGRGRTTWEAVRRPYLEEPLTEVARDRARHSDPYPAPPRRRGLLRRRGGGAVTLAESARAELADPRLVALLEAVVWDYGLDPAAAPASAAMLAYLEQTFGTWYPAGGMRALADALYQRCLTRRVEFRFGAEAERILARDGRTAGVALADGTELPAGHVVWAAAWPSVDTTPPPGPSGVAGGGTGRCVVLLALRGPRPQDAAHRTVVHRGDGAPPVTVFRPDDTALWPDSQHHTAVLSAPVPGQGTVDWTAGGYAEQYADGLLDAVEAAGLRLREQVLWREVRTPATTERETGAPSGAVPPPVLPGAGGALLRPANPGRLAGSYRAGGLAHPGGGLVHAGMSGALVAGLVVEGPDWRGSY